jgi:hypothetical protein
MPQVPASSSHTLTRRAARPLLFQLVSHTQAPWVLMFNRKYIYVLSNPLAQASVT